MNRVASAILSASRQTNFASLLKGRTLLRNMSAAALSKYKFETLAVTSPQEYVYQVELNRPEKLNAMSMAFWREMVECFQTISKDSDCRVIVLSGAGRLFTAGLDLQDNAELIGTLMGSDELPDPARIAAFNREIILRYQESFYVLEKCPKPVIAAVHGACIGGGLCMISGCDIRLCTEDAFFQVKETDLGITADVGVLQWLPVKTGNDSLARELCYTARKFSSQEAKELGLVSRVHPDRDALMANAMDLAATIAAKSPVAIQGTKVNLNYARDHTLADSFDYAATWNAGFLQTEDVMKAVTGSMTKTKPEFSKL